MRFLKSFLIGLLWLFPLVFLILPTPFAQHESVWRWGALIGSYALLFLSWFSQRVSSYLFSSELQRVIVYTGVVAFPVLAYLSLSFLSDRPFLLTCFVIVCLACVWGCYRSAEEAIVGRSVVALVLTVSSFLWVELCLGVIPQSYLLTEVSSPPSLTTPDRGNLALQKHGFRGKRPCRTCSDDLIRIVTMGGSSTYGVPMYHSADTYSAELQRLLDVGRPWENYEVLNGGIAGFGLTQILDALEQVVLKTKPDIVSVCAWFNDSSQYTWLVWVS